MKKYLGIVLSYKRPKNISRICNTILESNILDKLILSNNNPKIDIREYLSIQNPKLEIINQKSHKNSSYRFVLAESQSSNYDDFVFIDDDIFLSASQIIKLKNGLDNAPGANRTNRYKSVPKLEQVV